MAQERSEYEHLLLEDAEAPVEPRTIAPGKRSLTSRLPPRGDLAPPAAAPEAAPVQRKARATTGEDPFALHLLAARDGLAGPAEQLPHLATIQAAFGRHDVSQVAAHVGGPAAAAADRLGAEAYATGGEVAFRAAPDLHTAAHEAAHVVQQRGGVQLRGGLGEVGDVYERHADAVADRVVAGQSAEDLLDAMAPGAAGRGDGVQRKAGEDVQLLAGDGERGVGGDDIRVAILNIALATTPLLPLVAVVNAAGLPITAGAVGLRGSFMVGAGPGAGGGVDGMLFLDVANWRITPDVLPFAERGVGGTAGAGVGVVVGFRVSPHGSYGDPSASYSGEAINASIEALAGVGFSISPSVLQLQEGWIATTLSLGEQFGASLSVSHAESARLVGQRLQSMIAQATSSLQSVLRSLGAIADGVSGAVRSVFEQVFRIFMPERWNLAGYLPHEADAMRRFGTYMNQVIAAQGGIDAFLRSESAPDAPSISARVGRHSTWDIPLMIAVNNALNARYHRQMGGTEATVGNIWEPTHFNTTTYLNFLRFCMDNGLLA